MKHLYIIIVSIIVNLPLLTSAESSSMSAELEGAFAELDSVMLHKKKYQEALKERVRKLEHEADKKRGAEYVKSYKEIYGLVSHMDGRKALKVLDKIKKTDVCKQDARLDTWCELQRASITSTMGFYGTAQMLLWPIDAKTIYGDDKHIYFHTLYNNMTRVSQFTSNIDEEFGFTSDTLRLAYLDSLICYQTSDVSRAAYNLERQMESDGIRRALKEALPFWQHSDGLLHLRLGYAMANAYKQLGDVEKQMYYLAKITTQDIEDARTDYKGLPLLVEALYKVGDIDRAYRYLVCMMEDANIFPSHLLQLETAKYFPLVNRRYASYKSNEANKEKMRRDSILLTYSLLVIALLVTLYLGWKYNNARKEKKRADQLQKALDQAAVADRIKTVFIQNMRHEIRTPLNAIVGFAQLMSNDLSEDERAQYNAYIQESNNQLLSTLDDIIDVSNMEVGTFNFRFADTSIDDMCHQRMEDVRELLAPGVELVYKTNSPGLHVFTDYKRIGQVIYNLLTNACKNTSKGSITLSAEHRGDFIQFTVADTGVGVPPDKAKAIFEHFEKLDSYSPGLGLGLYVCNLIANALNGSIYLNTEYKGGAQFVFSVPVKQKAAEQDK